MDIKSRIVQILNELTGVAGESEVVEFKGSVNDNYSTHDIGKYFSALSNEANLKGISSAWLVFGVDDKDKTYLGTTYRSDLKRLDFLKKQIADGVTNEISFREIHVVNLPERILVFEIPPAPRGIPVAWKGHYYARDGESLVPLNLEKIERIRQQNEKIDWSKVICKEATLADLDSLAIARARNLFKQRFPDIAESVDSWDDTKFLNKAKITIQGQITRAAILLLGREESEHFISPGVAKIRWILKDSKGNVKDYLIVTCPFILNVDVIFSKIRNVIYRLEKRQGLFPEEISQYSPDLVYEALNNCIAHQDYALGGRINVIEKEDEIIFSNCGDFIPGSVEKVIEDDSPEERYRNEFLCTAMFNLRMIQTRGGGIRMMFNEQRRRFFPLPEYDLSDSKVKVTVIGKVLDLDYAEILLRDRDLTLNEIMMLDKVQKKKGLTRVEIKHLRSKQLIEGSKPNYHISASLAQKIGQKANYSRFRAFDKSYYLDLIINAVQQHGHLNRSDIDMLLWDKLSDLLTEDQKRNKITNLIAELRKNKKIVNCGSDRKPKWFLVESGSNK